MNRIKSALRMRQAIADWLERPVTNGTLSMLVLFVWMLGFLLGKVT